MLFIYKEGYPARTQNTYHHHMSDCGVVEAIPAEAKYTPLGYHSANRFALDLINRRNVLSSVRNVDSRYHLAANTR